MADLNKIIAVGVAIATTFLVSKQLGEFNKLAIELGVAASAYLGGRQGFIAGSRAAHSLLKEDEYHKTGARVLSLNEIKNRNAFISAFATGSLLVGNMGCGFLGYGLGNLFFASANPAIQEPLIIEKNSPENIVGVNGQAIHYTFG